MKAHDILKKVDQRNSIDSQLVKQLELKAVRASDPKRSSKIQRDIAMVKKLDSKLNQSVSSEQKRVNPIEFSFSEHHQSHAIHSKIDAKN